MQRHNEHKQNHKQRWYLGIGLVGLLSGISLLAYTYLPLLQAEWRYRTTPPLQNYRVESRTGVVPTGVTLVTPVDSQFGILIPRIQANAPVIENVNPLNAAEYQQKLALGVAHARGTAVPTEPGRIFLFAHSAGDMLMARRYNAVFYLLNKLETGDDIYVFYAGEKYRYVVTRSEEVAPENVSYLTGQAVEKTLTLMTCTPPGTTFKRLLVHAELVANEGR